MGAPEPEGNHHDVAAGRDRWPRADSRPVSGRAEFWTGTGSSTISARSPSRYAAARWGGCGVGFCLN